MPVHKNSMGMVGILVAIFGLLVTSVLPPRTIHGIVLDATTQKPIAGATITERGTKNSTSSGQDGKFSLTISGVNTHLVCQSVGFNAATTVVAATDTSVTILLSSSSAQLDEVVVTAYANRKAKEVTISSVQVLQGKVAGVAIRGQSSISNGYYSADREEEADREGYSSIDENKFRKAKQFPLSTFSIDVDAASYSNIRRFLNGGNLPPAGSVRTEELINYFDYTYDGPKDEHPFAVHTAYSECPWNEKHQLVSIGLQGRKIETANLPASNLVFLIDVSGSMDEPNKLPLVQQSLILLTDQLREEDRVALVVYAGAAGLVLPPTTGDQKTKIKDAIRRLEAGGSTAGGAGLRLAYKTAKENFLENGNNRVILCTDGDFNVGESSDASMEKLITEERKSNVFLTVLGFGTGNYQDAKMQLLADKGNGNHAYIDGLTEAKKVLVKEFGGTLFTIAKDVKLQIEFNPALVQSYRLIGYENRMLQDEDFNDDIKDAGEMGSGHTVTALYEIIPVGVKDKFSREVDPLEYQDVPKGTEKPNRENILTLKIRYKEPKENKSKLMVQRLSKESRTAFDDAPENLRFSAAVAEWGMLLNKSEYLQQSSFDQVLNIASGAMDQDTQGYRKEFLELVQKSKVLGKDNAAR
ncbi:vWA domain-containing protein [Flavihumibacter petaseus]|uniref:VWFA domain-containing protein n=1 Tax=Flavihumibacter petaseus NBRC 106054 TaxID=1220578 RepID=A0A0E9N0S8_9BACT|nr:VWA domain-containing protein [Flavihumibacter petaseus]GAO42965.1 hypothetical protein FPE01S_02_00700 [Flavihumibacter petaseus NBRC 106054]